MVCLQLFLFNFYPFLQRYMQPHQRGEDCKNEKGREKERKGKGREKENGETSKQTNKEIRDIPQVNN